MILGKGGDCIKSACHEGYNKEEWEIIPNLASMVLDLSGLKSGRSPSI